MGMALEEEKKGFSKNVGNNYEGFINNLVCVLTVN